MSMEVTCVAAEVPTVRETQLVVVRVGVTDMYGLGTTAPSVVAAGAICGGS